MALLDVDNGGKEVGDVEGQGLSSDSPYKTDLPFHPSSGSPTQSRPLKSNPTVRGEGS